MCLAMSSSSLSCFHKRKLPTLFSAPESVAFEGSICSTVCMKSENPFKRMKRRRSAAKMVGGSGCSPIVARSCFTPICNVSSTNVCERESTPNARGSSFHAAICKNDGKFAISLMQQRQPRHIAQHSHTATQQSIPIFLLFRVFARTWACANRRVELVRVYNESPFIGNRRRRAHTRQKVKMLFRRRHRR